MSIMKKLIDTIKTDGDFGKPLGERVMHPTGFMLFDYKNAQYSTDKNGNPIYHKGLDAGRITTIIGKSGTGKTTLAIQMAYNIVKPYENGVVFILDFEGSSTKERIKSITGIDDEEFEKRFTVLQTGISTETVFAIIREISKFKKENRDSLLVEGPHGVEILPPTVVIVDSIATMQPKNSLEADAIEGQMATTQAAKMNTQLFRKIPQHCITNNIMPIFINHINAKVDTSYIPTQTLINYGLRQDETLVGGYACVYLTNTLIRLTSSTKLTEDSKYKIPGFEVKVEFGKSRTAPAGTVFTMIFDQVNGYQNELSLLNYLLSDKTHIGGTGRGYYLKELPEYKFTASNFLEKLETHPPIFKETFFRICEEMLQAEVKKPKIMSEVSETYLDDEEELSYDEEELSQDDE